MAAQAAKPTGWYGNLTPAQEDALKQLCTGLPGALTEASLEPKPLSIWGVSLVGVDQSTTLTRAQAVVLLKFLRARQFNVANALSMLVSCLKWRRDFDVEGLYKETFPPQLAGAGQLSGRDRWGNPVTYNFYGADVDIPAVMASPGGVAAFVRWRVKLMEDAIRQLDFDREGGPELVMQIHDYSGANMFRMDPNVKAATRQIIKLFQDNYPELLSTKLFLNVPYIMEFLFGLFSGLADPATRAKLHMVAPARMRSVLLQHIDPLQLPERFGGFLERRPVPTGGHVPAACKQLTLQPGESHAVSLVVGAADAEVLWGAVSTGALLNVKLAFRPEDNQEAARAAAAHPDHVPGAAPSAATTTAAAAVDPAASAPSASAPSAGGGADGLVRRRSTGSVGRDSQLLLQSHTMAIEGKDCAGGRLRLGCVGEVSLTIEYPRPRTGYFFSPPAATLYFVLSDCTAGGQAGEPAGAAAYGSGAPPARGDTGVTGASYKSMGCESLQSADVAVAGLEGVAEGAERGAAEGAEAVQQVVRDVVDGAVRGAGEEVPEPPATKVEAVA